MSLASSITAEAMIFDLHRANWDAFAHIDPRWAVLSNPKKRGGLWTDDEFYGSGRRFVADHMAHLVALGVIDEMRLIRGGGVLDFGCGPGRNTRPLTFYFDRVVGYDVSQRMLELGREAVPAAEFVLNDMDDLSPFGAESFDLVFAHLVLNHIDLARLELYFTEIHRVLKPGGVLSFDFLSHPSGREGTDESGPDPEWTHDGLRPYYEVNPVRVDAMMNGLLKFGFLPVDVRLVPDEGTSWHAYDYVAVKS